MPRVHEREDHAGEVSENNAPKNSPPNKGITKVDFVMRLVAAISTLGSTIAVGTINRTIPFLAQFVHLKYRSRELPTFTFFFITNATTTAYLVISLVLSIFHILKSDAKMTRTLLIILDMIILTLLTSGASAAAAIIHLAHRSNGQTNWVSICQRYGSFCERVSGSLAGSFIGVIVLMLLIILSAVALSKS
ncbi:hypothetical protein CASFOL_026611 [Castilleja foliolosa]|uniref:CASP-like protein n=1 Tax=Castilleja foliolosa TaxID=1961234 RepID=A0ABD3CJH2_9LAMI